ncbi:MAG: hypothetical protein AB7D57_11800 [Desulfovibrionaceae bacterium]
MARAAETGDAAPLRAAQNLTKELTREMTHFANNPDRYTYIFLVLRRA